MPHFLSFPNHPNRSHLQPLRLRSSSAALTETVSKIDQTAVYPEPEEAHDGRITELKSEMAESREDIASLNSELAELRQQRREIESLLRDLDRQRLRLEQIANEKEPKIRSIMSLYAHITNVAWNFDRSDRVAGTVSDKKKGDVRRFDFDPAVQDRAKIIEQLWELMEG